jgi:hypothetical protein
MAKVGSVTPKLVKTVGALSRGGVDLIIRSQPTLAREDRPDPGSAVFKNELLERLWEEK